MDLLLDVARRARGLLVLVVLLAALGVVLGRAAHAAAVVLACVLVWVGARWVRLGRTMRQGLGVGQQIAVAHRGGDDPAVLITDVTGEVALGRGSAMVITRFRGIDTFYGRQLSFVLPAGLLTEGEIAFLEGHAPLPEDGAPTSTEPASDLPLSLEITEAVQRRTGAAIARAVATSADVLLPVVTAIGILLLGATIGSGPILTVGVVVGTVSLLTAPRAVVNARSMVRSAYPVGGVVHAEVGAEAFTIQTRTVLHATRWASYDARRITADAVLLRRKGPFLAPDVFFVFPRDLFDDAATAQLAAALPRTF